MKEKFLRRREPIKKLTLVSTWYRGQTIWRFVNGEIGEDGVCRVPESVIKTMTSGVYVGTTFTLG